MSFATRWLWLVVAGAALVLTGCDAFTGSDQIQQLETQNAQLQGTIQVMGTPALTIAALEQAATQNVVFQAQLTESAVDLLEAQATLTVLELSGVTASTGNGAPGGATPAPAAPPGDQQAAVPTPPPTESMAGTMFTNTVVATGLDAQDCPVAAGATFENTVGTLYVNTRIDRLPAGSTIGARWYANGELYFDDVQCWIPDQDWQDICAYCSVGPDPEVFPAGSWTVEMYLDGQLMAQTRFEVFDPAASAGDAQ